MGRVTAPALHFPEGQAGSTSYSHSSSVLGQQVYGKQQALFSNDLFLRELQAQASVLAAPWLIRDNLCAYPNPLYSMENRQLLSACAA